MAWTIFVGLLIAISAPINAKEADGIRVFYFGNSLTQSSRPEICENIAITNCVVHSNVNAIKLGTEGSGGYRNVVISNIVVHKKNIESPHHHGMADGCGGISLMMVDGGVMENIRISNIVMDGPRTPLFIRLANRARGYHPEIKVDRVGTLRDVVIDNITVRNAYKHMCHITGIEGHPVQGITISNFRMTCSGGGTAEDALTPVPESEKGYPDGGCLGMGAAYGFYIRYAENIRLRHIELSTQTPDLRPGIMAEHAAKIEIDHADIQSDEHGRAAIVFHQVHNAWIQACQVTGRAGTFIEVNGEDSADILLAGIRSKNIASLLKLGDGVCSEAVVLSDVKNERNVLAPGKSDGLPTPPRAKSPTGQAASIVAPSSQGGIS